MNGRNSGQDGTINFDTFPSQALSCSGSTGLISAFTLVKHPGNETGRFRNAKIVDNRLNNCNFFKAATFY